MSRKRSHFLLVMICAFVFMLFGCSCNEQSDKGISAAEKPESQQTPAKDNSEDSANEEDKTEAGSEQDAKEGAKKLFIIERSKNANIVRYDVQLTPEGKINPEQPVVAYWILHADKGQKAKLSWMQKKLAYGFKTEPAPSGDGYIMTMVPLPKREIRIVRTNNRVQARLQIDGQPAVLEKIYVDSDPGFTGPDVNYVKLFGKSIETDEKVEQKLLPD